MSWYIAVELFDGTRRLVPTGTSERQAREALRWARADMARAKQDPNRQDTPVSVGLTGFLPRDVVSLSLRRAA
jgi:hypothetical protein